MGWEGYERKAKAGLWRSRQRRRWTSWCCVGLAKAHKPLEGSGAGDRTCRTRHTAVDRGRSGEV